LEEEKEEEEKEAICDLTLVGLRIALETETERGIGEALEAQSVVKQNRSMFGSINSRYNQKGCVEMMIGIGDEVVGL